MGARSTSRPARTATPTPNPRRAATRTIPRAAASSRCPEEKIAVIKGLKEFIVVDTKDVLMICPRSEEQNVKKFIDDVKYDSGDKYI